MQLVKSQCDEGMIKRMAVEVCGLKKRSIDAIDNNLDSDFEIERHYRQLTGDDDVSDYLQNFNEEDVEGICVKNLLTINLIKKLIYVTIMKYWKNITYKSLFKLLNSNSNN